MKIGSGELSGRKLHTPPGSGTRPTSGRLKKSLFDVLARKLEDARVLDLYAGAGGLGLEALSRGASHAIFVERRRRACDALHRNIEELGLESCTEVIKSDVRAALAALRGRRERFELVFADPPYQSGAAGELLDALGADGVLSAGGLVAVEHHHKTELGASYGLLDRSRQLRTGESCLTFFERAPEPVAK